VAPPPRRASRLFSAGRKHSADVQTQPNTTSLNLRFGVDEEKARSSASSTRRTPDGVHRIARGLVADEIFPFREGI